MTKNFKFWLRWIPVLPGSLIAGFLATFPLHWIFYLSFAHNGTLLGFIELPSGSNVSIEYFLTPFVIALVFIYAGFEIAPKHKLRVAVILAVLYIVFVISVFILGMKNGIGMSLEIRSLGPILGLLLGLFIVWEKSKQAHLSEKGSHKILGIK